jgi:uncharacterized membrane protein YeaQ/YmgE (transglycosylase-associated protein family)
MDLVAWLLIGLVAGFLARLLVPGRDPIGIVGTVLLGLAGSVVGGFLAGVISPGNDDFNPAGLIGSIIGAIIALVIYRSMAGRGTRTV